MECQGETGVSGVYNEVSLFHGSCPCFVCDKGILATFCSYSEVGRITASLTNCGPFRTEARSATHRAGFLLRGAPEKTLQH